MAKNLRCVNFSLWNFVVLLGLATISGANNENIPLYKFLDFATNPHISVVDINPVAVFDRFKRQNNPNIAIDPTPTTNSDNSTSYGNATSYGTGSPSPTPGQSQTPAPTQNGPQPATAAPTTPTPLAPVDATDPDITMYNDHKYYTSQLDPNGYNTDWIPLSRYPGHVEHIKLSDAHRLAATIDVQFPFRFYGHRVDNITIATGGFLYMSPFLHKFLTATQYIAPLMANFDTQLGNESTISYHSDKTLLIVHWEKLHLQDHVTNAPFDFQVILRSDNSITFVYKDIPIHIETINSRNHPVKVGLSDAYYIDKNISELGLTRRTIYEYHAVKLEKNNIRPLSSYKLMPLDSCNVALSCDSCTKLARFSCLWCSVLNRCSDGIDWYRQHWLEQGCSQYGVTAEGCQLVTKPCSSGRDCSKIPQKPEEQSGIPTGAVAAIIIVILLLILAVVAFFMYAYLHPTSASGIWLMEHRPSVMKNKIGKMKFWKQSTPTGDKYAVESTA